MLRAVGECAKHTLRLRLPISNRDLFSNQLDMIRWVTYDRSTNGEGFYAVHDHQSSPLDDF